MTKRQLAVARFLLNTYEDAAQYADEVDPRRRRRSYLAGRLDAITARAREGFHELTGRLPAGVSIHELNGDAPAPWARERKP